MTTVPRYLGLTWDHPRGYRALEAAAAADDAIDLRWERQSLEGFEAHPIADLAHRYDLIVLDHPHLGEAVADQCLVPLESLFTPEEIADWEQASVGRSFASYHYAGKHWALPLDAATQVAAYRPDLLDGAALPNTWASVVDLAARRPVGLCLAGPHAVLSFMSLCVALGEAPASKRADRLVSTNVGSEALTIMAAIHRCSTPLATGKNPIRILDAMAGGAAIAYCPLIYGYVTYAAPSGGRHRVAFTDVPSIGPGGPLGSTLGGTGLAVTRRATITPSLLAHLRYLLSETTQRYFIPFHDGQPSARAAWIDAEVNRRCGNFYRDTLRTIDAAWVRPRHKGFIAFQAEASALLRAGLDAGAAAPSLLRELQERYARTCDLAEARMREL
jgi:multiple sugar transport system substrate-binding protein